MGYNYQTSENQRTRFLLGFDDPQNDSLAPIGSFLNTKGRSIHGELRHDLLVDNHHNLSVGASLGTRRFDLDFLAKPPLGLPFFVPDFRSTGSQRLQTAKVYLRDEVRLSPRLTAMGEMKVEQLKNRSSSVVTSPPGFPPGMNSTTTTAGVPNFMATYLLNPGSTVRLRARGLLGSVEDFDLLTPTDVFLYSFVGVPSLNLNSRGRSYELEFSHQLGQGHFCALVRFQRNLNSVKLDSGEPITHANFRSVRALVEGSFTPSTTYFVSTNFNNTKSTADLTDYDAGFDTNYELTRVPRFSMETGLQFLNHDGWFVQPTVAYIGSRLQPGDGTPRTKLSGFTLVNLRVGKRAGLRSTIFIEASNLTNQNYVSPGGFLGEQQPGRQFRAGIEKRF